MQGVERLAAQAASFAEALAAADEAALAAVVPDCPGWDAGELVRHLGGVHRWATEIVAGHRRPTDSDDHAARGPAGADPDGLRDWFAEGAAALVATLEATPADRPCRLLLGSGTSSFWLRRQTLETAMHHVDLVRALGGRPRTPTPEASLALDGIDEVLTMFAPRQVALGRTSPMTGELVVTAVDAARTWRYGEPGGAVAGLAGGASAVWLRLWGRNPGPGAELQETGEGAVLRAALRPGALTP